MIRYFTNFYVECLVKGYSFGGCLQTLEIQPLIILFCILPSTFHPIEWIHREMCNQRHYRCCTSIGVS